VLSKIRRNLRAFSLPLWIVAASFVGTIFLVWGKGSVSGPSASEVATVNGEGITLAEFNREYQNVVSTLKEQFGENFRNLVSDDELKRLALERLITRKLLLQLAREEGLEVSDWAVAKYISEIPAFQEEGKFSLKLYKEFLKLRHLTPQAFEETVREDLLVQKCLKVVENSPSITDFELKELYKAAFGKREFKYRLFLPTSFNPQISQEEIKKYYEENREMFKREGEEKYYVLKFPRGAEGEKRAKEAYALAKEGKFSELLKLGAKELNNEELKKELDDREENFLFKSEEDALVLAFKTKEAGYKSLEEVRGEIEELLRKEKASELARKAAEEYEGELPLKTGKIDVADFVKRFAVLPTENPEKLFLETKKGERVVVALANGYGVFSPTSELEAGEVDKEKEEKLKEFILKAKRDSNYQNLVSLLKEKAVVKLNPALFGGKN